MGAVRDISLPIITPIRDEGKQHMEKSPGSMDVEHVDMNYSTVLSFSNVALIELTSSLATWHKLLGSLNYIKVDLSEEHLQRDITSITWGIAFPSG